MRTGGDVLDADLLRDLLERLLCAPLRIRAVQVIARQRAPLLARLPASLVLGICGDRSSREHAPRRQTQTHNAHRDVSLACMRKKGGKGIAHLSGELWG